MNRIRATALVVGTFIAISATAALADHHPRARSHHPGANTFAGNCSFSGTVRFQPGLTNTPQRIRDVARAHGTCSGTLTDRRGRDHKLDGAVVRYFATDVANGASCAASAGATGTGRLVFPSRTVRFELSETRGVAVAELSLSGARGGSATGQANVNDGADPVEVAQACAGNGLRTAPVDIRIATTPTMSG